MPADNTPVEAPVAPPRPHVVSSPHGERTDPYYWLRDDQRRDPQVLAYLAAEEAYRLRHSAHVKPLEDALYHEIVARLKQDDSSVPYRKNGHWYYTRFETGREYPIFARRRDLDGAAEEILIDANAESAGREFYQLGALEVSPDNQWLAYCEDVVGRRQYQLRFKNLATGVRLDDLIADVESDLAWANDSRRLLYIAKDPETLLGRYVKVHTRGEDPAADALIFEQSDLSFYTGLSKSKSERYIFLSMESTTTSEWRYADADAADLRFQVFLPREQDHEYQIEHASGEFLIRSNWQARNFRLLRAAVEAPHGRAHWRELVAHRDDALIEDFEAFSSFVALSVRSGGLSKISIKPLSVDPASPGAAEFFIASDEAAYAMSIGANPEPEARRLRYSYSSLTTPTSVYEYDLESGAKNLLKREPVQGHFDPAEYQTEFVFATARDGKRIPVSLVYRKGFTRDGSAPLLQYGYGAYGLSMDPVFSSSRLSLLDRGFVYAIAHVRGGQELGREWYDDGRLLNKRHSFTDFIDVTRHLIGARYAAPDNVFAMGGSAGGLLVAAVANLSPELYRGIVAQVPFVDVVTTMLDDSIPLTTNEYEEWGDPADKAAYEYMLGYSPYDNVRRQDYPSMLVTTGLWDSQVQYFEPAKWVAKLRALKTDRNPLLFHIEMEAGHGGKSGRFQRYREIALEYAFILERAGLGGSA